ncbi:MAG TPA: hypothetical protein VFV41_01505 [Streptosporangiaceae bacterium]|nr:hypothetical protein [Streptosporangiaceae bacterium]
MDYVVGVLVLVVVIAIALGLLVIHHENAPGTRPSLAAARRAVWRSPIVSPGEACRCGGTLASTGEMSERFGALIGCSGCDRSWTVDGRRIRARRPA